MPNGSRNASRPWPAISATTAYEPLMRLCTARDRGEHLLGRQLLVARRALELVGEHVDQHLGVAAGVDVAAVDVEQLLLQRRRVGEVAVVDEDDAVRRIDVERLRLLLAVGVAGGRIAHLAEADVARQRAHVAGAKDVAHHAARLLHEALGALHRDDAGGVLAAMLQQQQGVVDQLVDRRLRRSLRRFHTWRLLDSQGQRAKRQTLRVPAGSAGAGAAAARSSRRSHSTRPRRPTRATPAIAPSRREGDDRRERRAARPARAPGRTPRPAGGRAAAAASRATSAETARASRPQTTSTTRNAHANASAAFKGEPALPTGTCGASHGPSQRPANQATNQPASDSTSKVKPRIAPTKPRARARRASRCRPSRESGHATDARHSVSSTAARPAVLALASAASASLARGERADADADAVAARRLRDLRVGLQAELLGLLAASRGPPRRRRRRRPGRRSASSSAPARPAGLRAARGPSPSAAGMRRRARCCRDAPKRPRRRAGSAAPRRPARPAATRRARPARRRRGALTSRPASALDSVMTAAAAPRAPGAAVRRRWHAVAARHARGRRMAPLSTAAGRRFVRGGGIASGGSGVAARDLDRHVDRNRPRLRLEHEREADDADGRAGRPRRSGAGERACAPAARHRRARAGRVAGSLLLLEHVGRAVRAGMRRKGEPCGGEPDRFRRRGGRPVAAVRAPARRPRCGRSRRRRFYQRGPPRPALRRALAGRRRASRW